MKRKNATRNALFTSVLALLLCVSMLVGTTFAWFTDSVESGMNKIVAGNLDVELEYSKDLSSWTPVQDAKTLFSNNLWEPGHTEVVYLKLSNLGSLALKYQFSVNFADTVIGTSVEGNEIKLSEHLMYNIVGVNEKFVDRDAAREAAEKGAQKLANYTEKGQMKAGDPAKTVALVVYMPETVGNEANYRGQAIPQIDLGINLYATQLENESDSFDNTYDEDAWVEGFKVYSAQDLQAAINAGETAIQLEGDITLSSGEPIMIPKGKEVTLNLNGVDLFAEDQTADYVIANMGKMTLLDTAASGAAAGSRMIKARGIYNGYDPKTTETNPEAEMTIKSGVYHAMGTNGGAAVFNYAKLTINGGTFESNGGYGLNNQATGVMTVKNATVNGGIYNLGTLNVDNSTVYQHLSGKHAIYNWAGKVTINGGNFGSVSGNELILADGEGASVEINGGTFNKIAKSWLFGAASGKNINFVIKGGTFNGYVNLPENTVDTIRPYGDPITVTGGIFNFDPTTWVVEGYTAVANSDGTWVVVPGSNATVVTNGLYFDGENTYYITNAEGLVAFAAEVNKGAEYEGNTYAGKTILLMNDIDLNGAEWDPIGNMGNSSKQFAGTFDGQGHTVSNFKITKKTADREGKNRSPHGFFGNVNGTIKNLTIDKANLTVMDDGRYAGILVGRLNGGLIDNCHVVNSSAEIDYWQIGGLVGMVNDGAVKNCTVVDTSVTGPAAVGAITGIMLTTGERTIENCTVKNCTITQNGSFGSSYDKMFGAVIGAINSGTLTVNVNGCEVENTEVLGETSDMLVGYIKEGDKVYIDGVLVVLPKVVVYDGTGIQDVLNTLNSGDTLILPAGTYVTTGTFAVPAGVTIMGKEGETVVIHQDSAAQDDIFNCAGDAVIQNITFESNRKGYAIAGNTKEHDTDGDITVIGCKFVGLATEKNYGIYKNLNGNLTVQDCTFDNYNNALCGINNGNGSQTVITGCTFTNINGEAIGYVASTMPANFEADVIANNTGLTADNVIGY